VRQGDHHRLDLLGRGFFGTRENRYTGKGRLKFGHVVVPGACTAKRVGSSDVRFASAARCRHEHARQRR